MTGRSLQPWECEALVDMGDYLVRAFQNYKPEVAPLDTAALDTILG